MQSFEQLLAHELREMLATKQAVASAHQRLSQCQTIPQLGQAFGTHEYETQNQIGRLQQALSTIGQQPAPPEDAAISETLDHHERVERSNQFAPQVHAAFDIGIGLKIAHYEIATYEHLVSLASALGYQQMARSLQTSLDEEHQQVQRLHGIMNTLDYAQQPAQAQAPVQGGQQQPAGQASQQEQLVHQ